MQREKKLSLLEKIKKLLEVGNDNRGNANESQTALLKAQKLMVEHGISNSDLSNPNFSSNDVEDKSISGYKNLEWWHGCLSVIISENFKCFCYVNQRREGYKKILKSINFVGHKEDIKVAKEVFYYAIMMIEYHSDIYVRNYRINNPHRTDFKGIENKFVQGYLEGLKGKFEEQKEQNKNEWGLVLVKDEQVNKHIEKLNLTKAKPSKIRSSNNLDHYNSGFEKGKNFNVIGGHIEE